MRAIWHQTETWFLSLGRPEFAHEFHLQPKKNVVHFGQLSKVRGLCVLIERNTIWSKKLSRSAVVGACCGFSFASGYQPHFALATPRKTVVPCVNLKANLVFQKLLSRNKPKFAWRLIAKICSGSGLPVKLWKLFWKAGVAICIKASLVSKKRCMDTKQNSLQDLSQQLP